MYAYTKLSLCRLYISYDFIGQLYLSKAGGEERKKGLKTMSSSHATPFIIEIVIFHTTLQSKEPESQMARGLGQEMYKTHLEHVYHKECGRTKDYSRVISKGLGNQLE